MTPSFLETVALGFVRLAKGVVNTALELFGAILFRPIGKPTNILVYKIGNIGDIICAIPSFIAIRETYPDVRVTLLTSPGSKSAPGAHQFLEGAWYFDEIQTYFHGDTASWEGKKALIKKLGLCHYDLFIQMPDDWAPIHTLVRNMLFAKAIGVKSAIGFRLRTILNVFRKTQIDHTLAKNEVESLLVILGEYGIAPRRVRFDIPGLSAQENIPALKPLEAGVWVAFCPGGKYEEKKWPVERFQKIAQYLAQTYRANIVVLGGKEDFASGEALLADLPTHSINLAGTLTIGENAVALLHAQFLLTNDTGLMHLAAALRKPTVALFSIRNILGQWFPYGDNHEVLFHKYIKGNYRLPQTIKASMEAITLDEVKAACDRILAREGFRGV